MDWLYLFYALFATFLVFGAKAYGRGKWNEEAFSLGQMKYLQGFFVVCIFLHHAAQKTCAPWHNPRFIVHGLDPFVPYGYFFVALFFFCSGYGLYKSWQTKQDYLKHFVRRRILPVIIAFYISEIIYTVIRLLMGEKMNAGGLITYILGIRLGNFNAWYAIIIPFFYLFFYLAFRFCKKDTTAILWVWGAVIAYTVFSLFIDHNNYWISGEWWYNSVWLFPLGLTFAKHQEKALPHIKKFYWLYLLLAIVAVCAFDKLSDVLTNGCGWYYGEQWGDKLKVLHRGAACLCQWMASFSFVCVIFLANMKIRIGNKLLGFFGAMTLEFYLMHGIFIELFGFDFLEFTKSITYIRNVPLYLLVTFACAVPVSFLFKLLLKPVNKALKG